MTIIAATGHRPARLGGFDNRTRLALGGLATEYLSRERPEKVIVGMALGWDQAVAGAAWALDIPFIAAVPFPGQPDRWPEEARILYHWLLEQAESVHYVCASTQILSPRQVTDLMRYRNQWMVDHCTKVVALYDGTFGGTAQTVSYAAEKGVPVDNLWRRWSLDVETRALLA